jgi:uncharacterized protein (UPF0248 family)
MKIKNILHFKELANNENEDFEDFYIVIADGLARSSKRILYRPEDDEFSIIHEIDESFQECNSSELGQKTNFIEAIAKGALYKS